MVFFDQCVLDRLELLESKVVAFSIGGRYVSAQCDRVVTGECQGSVPTPEATSYQVRLYACQRYQHRAFLPFL